MFTASERHLIKDALDAYTGDQYDNESVADEDEAESTDLAESILTKLGAETTREQRLEDLLDRHSVEPDYMGDWEGRYFALLAAVIDGENSAATTCPTLEAACEWLSGGFDNSNPREPALIVDLNTGDVYMPRTHVTVTAERVP